MRCISSLYFRLEKTTPCSRSSWCQDMSNSNLPAHDSCCCTCACWAHEIVLIPLSPLSEASHPSSHNPCVIAPTGYATWRHRACAYALGFACYRTNMLVCCCCQCVPVVSLPFRTIHPIRCTLHCSQVAQGAKMLPSWDHGGHAQFKGLTVEL